MLEHKGYYGSVEYSAKDHIFHGKIALINDLITFEANNVKNLEKAFQESVDDYLETCQKVNKTPQKIFRGVFNVRIPALLHQKAYLKAKQLNISLNKFVQRAIKQEIDG